MPMIRPSGEPVEIPHGYMKSRGRRISEDEARRLRDMLGALLMDGLGLSRVDASRVLSMGAHHETLNKRVSRIPIGLRNRFRDLWRDMATGKRSARV